MKIISAEFITSSSKLSQCPTDKLKEVAFIGRSNVGKSSLINYLTNNKKLSKTSSTPGKTLLINHFLINEEFYIVDLPGYGYAKVSKTKREQLEVMISAYILNRNELQKLYILIDARHEPQNIDLVFIENLIDTKIPFSIIMTKCDKLSRNKYTRNAMLMLKAIKNLGSEEVPNIIFTSTVNDMGAEELLKDIQTTLT